MTMITRKVKILKIEPYGIFTRVTFLWLKNPNKRYYKLYKSKGIDEIGIPLFGITGRFRDLADICNIKFKIGAVVDTKVFIGKKVRIVVDGGKVICIKKWVDN